MGKERHVSIIGDGAMGVLFGSLLSAVCHTAVFSRNEERCRLRNSAGITVSGDERVFHPLFTSDKELMRQSDLVIIFVKSASTRQVLSEYGPFIADDAYVMTLQNGAGHLEELEGFFPASRIVIGVTEHNASLADECRVNHGGTGPTAIGMKDGEPPAWIPEILREASFETSVSGSVMRSVWRKLLTNSSLSTATALLMCPIDGLKGDAAFALVANLLREAVDAAECDGYSFSYGDVLSQLRAKVESSHGAYTSIYSDLRSGRRTEMDYISGYVAARGVAGGLAMAYQRAAVDIIHAKEGISSDC